MAKTIEQILGYVYLTGLVEDIKTGVPDVLPPAFWSTKTSVQGDAGRYMRHAGTRQTSRRVEYGASSVKRALKDIGSFDVKLFHTYEHIDLRVKDYQALRAYTDYSVQRMGMQEVDRQALQFRTLFDNTRKSLVYSLLSKGAIYWDAEGHLLHTSSGATHTVDYNISANNKQQLNGIIGASWATATTDIPGDLRELKRRARQQTGYELKYAYYGINIPTYLTQNNNVKDYLARNPQLQNEWLRTGEIPDGLFNLTWVPVYESFFDDKDGVTREWFDPDSVTFTPEINNLVYEMMEGTYPVPKTFMPLDSLQSTMNSFELITGMGAYGIPIHDPMTARIYAFDTCLPVWKVPDAIYLADVTP